MCKLFSFNSTFKSARSLEARTVGRSAPGQANSYSKSPSAGQVRSAVFDMLAAAGGRAGVLPSGSRWLDLFAGTGSVGLEALSRGAAHCRFIELDHWVVSNVRAHHWRDGAQIRCLCKSRLLARIAWWMLNTSARCVSVSQLHHLRDG